MKPPLVCHGTRTGEGPRRSSSGGDGARIRGVMAECRGHGGHTSVFIRGRRELMEVNQARCLAFVAFALMSRDMAGEGASSVSWSGGLGHHLNLLVRPGFVVCICVLLGSAFLRWNQAALGQRAIHVLNDRAAGHMSCLPPSSCTCVGGRSYHLPDHSFESQGSPCLVSMLSAVCQACSMATMELAPFAARSCSFARVTSTRLAGTRRDASANCVAPAVAKLGSCIAMLPSP